MFQSIREVLKNVASSKVNKVDANLAEIIIRHADQNIFLRSKELAAKAFVSESSLTAFSKRIGYEGYREVYIRLMVESEYYNYFTNNESNKNEIVSKFDHNTFIDEIDAQFDKIQKIASNIKSKDKLFILSSYEVMHHGQLVANALWEDKQVYFSANRKTDRNFINKITNQDEVLVLLVGLDNGELFENLKTLDLNNINYDVIGSSSQTSKLIPNQDNTVLFLNKTVISNKKTRALIRNGQMNYTLTHLISLL
ncbi:MurR/RpiR family transcriptional regulator [Spiroplasma alleghenense]|uniref:HTH rpiR-type domain-containing protein n=1 Tax=Spiroplasma alleghenense TaxID=216931 RepID=A0A345Z4Y5_9MOLU|nr:MurR/RpiR family transcriptional regulator [Spiroplasma alleghenense]AXK51664.1 hypothetical protein SALLE_v1c09940 [Spiroplasma alleghenense]